jgi:small subunit ribosomal protein S4
MGKTLIPRGKMSRREGVPLSTSSSILKVMQKRPYAPGAHGSPNARPPKMSGYGTQLREKQKAKRLYGMLEKQFRNYFNKAVNMDGNTRPQGRQMVSHAMFMVNGQRVNIASYQVRVGDIIEVRQGKQAKKVFADLAERQKTQSVPGWLHREDLMKGKVVSIPTGEDLKEAFDPTLIVEFYSMR